jgi:hypothetical protein
MEDSEGNYNSGIKFNEGYQTNSSVSSNTPKMICWVIDYSGGLVKDERGASYVLFGVAIVFIIISLFLVFGGEETKSDYTPVPVTGMEFEDVNWPPF